VTFDSKSPRDHLLRWMGTARCKTQSPELEFSTSHTNPNAATIDYIRGTGSQSTGGGTLGKRLRFRSLAATKPASAFKADSRNLRFSM
jgi:hypothetical protein